MAKNKVKEIVIKTERKAHLHTCQTCKSDDVTVISGYLNTLLGRTAGQGTAKCENCKTVREF